MKRCAQINQECKERTTSRAKGELLDFFQFNRLRDTAGNKQPVLHTFQQNLPSYLAYHGCIVLLKCLLLLFWRLFQSRHCVPCFYLHVLFCKALCNELKLSKFIDELKCRRNRFCWARVKHLRSMKDDHPSWLIRSIQNRPLLWNHNQ